MLQNAYGLAVTTDSPVTLDAINHFTQQALSYGSQTQIHLFRGQAADRNCALIHAYTAAYYLSQEETCLRKQAIAHLNVAQQQLDTVTERERWTVQAIAAWATGNIQQAIVLYKQIVEQYPQDLLAIQQAQYHHFYQGDSRQLLHVAEQALPANPDCHYLYGMVAFGLEQCHRLVEAEAMALKAIAFNRNDPWAHHAIAHVLEAQGRIDEGIAWMERHADTWEPCNSMLYTHNWWHITLFYLAKRAFQTVLQLYDQHVWGRARKDSSKDQVGAIATLIRLELQGVDVSSRWQELSRYLAPRLHEHLLPFQDLHYVYAFARSNHLEQATEMLQSMQLHARFVHPALRQSWLEVTLPIAKGLVAHAIGHWSEAVARLSPVLPSLQEVGGSHTQRDVFHELYRDALRKAQHQHTIVTFSARSPNPEQKPDQHSNSSGAAISHTITPHSQHVPKLAVYQKILHNGGHISC